MDRTRHGVRLSLILVLLAPGCQSIAPKLNRPDAIDGFAKRNGHYGLTTRREVAPSELIGKTPTGAASAYAPVPTTAVQIHDVQSIRGVAVEIPDEAAWRRGTTTAIEVASARAGLATQVQSALAEVDARFGSGYTETMLVANVDYFSLSPDWISRTPWRHDERATFGDPLIVTELMRVGSFGLRRQYDKADTALEVKNFLADKLGPNTVNATAGAHARTSQVDIQLAPAVIGVKLGFLSAFAKEPKPSTRGNLDTYGYVPLGDIVHDIRSPATFCDIVQNEDAGLIARNTQANTGRLVIPDDVEAPVVIDTLPTSVRIDLVDDGKLVASEFLANFLLDEIAPSETAFAQVAFPRPLQALLRKQVRRAVRGGVPDESLVITELLGGDEYEVIAYFYDTTVAEEYEQKIRFRGIQVERVGCVVRANYDRERPLAVAAKTAPWGALRLADAPGESQSLADILRSEYQLWPGGQSPQQLVLLRASSPYRITEQSSPYVEPERGSTSVKHNLYVGRTFDVMQQGRRVLADHLIHRLCGGIDLRNVSDASATIREDTKASLIASGLRRRQPRGVWVDTSSEYVVTDAVSLDAIDLDFLAGSSDGAEHLAQQFQSRFPGVQIHVDGSALSVRGVHLDAHSSMRFVLAQSLDEFVPTKGVPSFNAVGVEQIDDERPIRLGETGFSIELRTAPGYIYTYSGPSGTVIVGHSLVARLYAGGRLTGSNTPFSSIARGWVQTIPFDVEHGETLEVEVSPLEILPIRGLGSKLRWRLIGRPEPFPTNATQLLDVAITGGP